MSIESTLSGSQPARRRAAVAPGLVLALVLGVQLMVMLDATVVNVALPGIRASLDFTTASLSWVLTAYTLTFGGLLLLGARAGDLFGRRLTLLVGVSLFTVSSFAGGMAPSAGVLVAARALQGVGGAIAAPAALTTLTTLYSEGAARTRALGYYTAVSIGAAAIGLIAGGVLTQALSWRWVLLVNVPIGIGLVAAAAAIMPRERRVRGHIDVPGAVSSTLGVALLVFGFTWAASNGWSDPLTLAAFGLGAALLVLFVVVEQRAPEAITPLRLFAHRHRSAAYGGRALLTTGMQGMFFFLSQFLQGVLGYSPLVTGLAFLPITIALFGASQASSRWLVNWFGGRRVLAVGVAISALGTLWLAFLGAGSDYLSVLGPLVLCGVGNGLAFVPLTGFGLEGVAPRDAGAASGLLNVTQQIGGSLGLALLVSIFGAASAAAATHPVAGAGAALQARFDFAAGADRVFLVAAGFLVATLVLTIVAIRERRTVPA
ncbi:MAG: MFS transporter [Candidatus Dormibacteraceae bacterium]